MIGDGLRLTKFRAEETTEIPGNVAQRVNFERKAGVIMSKWFDGKGIKVFPVVCTASDWRICAIAWYDETISAGS